MRIAFLLAAVLLGCTAPPAAPPIPDALPAMSTPEAPVLFDFESGDLSAWTIQNDGVMGGKSKGAVEVQGGALVFTGNVVTRGGGFTSALVDFERDLSRYSGIEMRVRGGGRTFELNVDDGTRRGWRDVARRAPFPTASEWQTVRIAFDALRTSVHGQPVRADPLDRSSVKGIGLYIIDGQDGPFRLEVDWIRPYASSTE